MEQLRRCLVLIGLVFAALIVVPLPGTAQRVDVRVVAPPPYRFATPPSVVVIPGTYVYVIPDINTDIFFFSGYWYRPYEGRWFRATSYGGPWQYCPDPSVPRALVGLPPDYRNVPPGYRRIPYAALRRNWAGWERDRYWDKDRDWREGWHGRLEERREGGAPREERGRGEGRDRGGMEEQRHDERR